MAEVHSRSRVEKARCDAAQSALSGDRRAACKQKIQLARPEATVGSTRVSNKEHACAASDDP